MVNSGEDGTEVMLIFLSAAWLKLRMGYWMGPVVDISRLLFALSTMRTRSNMSMATGIKHKADSQHRTIIKYNEYNTSHNRSNSISEALAYNHINP